jgi:hypothetical protein
MDRWWRRAGAARSILAVAVILAGCSNGSPSSPTGAALPLTSGNYLVTFSAADLGGAGPPCLDAESANMGFVVLEMTGRQDDDAFRAAASDAGSLRLELRRGLTMGGGTGTGLSVAVSGSVQGWATNQNVNVLPGEERPLNVVRFDGSASVQGEVIADGVVAHGRVMGGAAFVSPDGVEVRCVPGTVTWSLTRSDPR